MLGAHAGFQDGIVPRAPQAAATAGGPAACSAVDYTISFCSSAIPGFATADETELAECFCYSSTSWIPDAFDGAIETCAQYAATAFPASAYSNVADLEGFCSSLGDVGAGGSPATVSATTTPTPVTPAPASETANIFTNPGCSIVGFALDSCNSVSPGFTTMDVTSQARCLCYSSTVWIPNDFDEAVSTCAEYVSSAAPSSLSAITGLEGFCSDIGNVLADGGVATGTGGNDAPLATNTGKNTPRPTATTTTPFATAVATTIQQAPTSTEQSLGSSGIHKGLWGLGLLVVAVSMMSLA